MVPFPFPLSSESDPPGGPLVGSVEPGRASIEVGGCDGSAIIGGVFVFDGVVGGEGGVYGSAGEVGLLGGVYGWT